MQFWQFLESTYIQSIENLHIPKLSKKLFKFVESLTTIILLCLLSCVLYICPSYEIHDIIDDG